MTEPRDETSRAWGAQGLARRLLRFLVHHGSATLLVLVVAVATMRFGTFLTARNIGNVLRQNSMLGFVALGATFVILSGGVDLSVGSLVALSGMIAAQLSSHGSIAAIAGAIAATTAIGFLNGAAIVHARIQPFIATLATMIAGRGISLAWANEQSIPSERTATALEWLGRGAWGPLPAPVLLLVAAYGVGVIVLAFTPFGRHVYAIGDNAEAASLLGLPVKRIERTVYAISGALAGVGGVVLTGRLGVAQPVAGRGWELDAIAAVLLGGTLLGGGQGGATSTLVGVVLLGVLFNVLNLEGSISSWWQVVIRGALLLAIVIGQNRLAAVMRRADR
jgi:ribose/xylose/arabinose/galactoside ABC-type transport system permease subunit